MDDLTLGWLAGLLEGEGCFHLQDHGRYPRITLQMTDEDVVRSLHTKTGVGTVKGPYFPSGPNHKPSWRWLVSKREAVEDILLSVYPLMGNRRQAKIQACLAYTPPPRPPRTNCKLRNHPMTPDNTYVSPGGHKFCIACYVIRNGYPPKKHVAAALLQASG